MGDSLSYLDNLLPECIAFTRVHCATFYQSASHHEEFEDVTMDVTMHVTPPSRRPFSRGF